MRVRRHVRCRASSWNNREMKYLPWEWRSHEHPPGTRHNALYGFAGVGWHWRCSATLAACCVCGCIHAARGKHSGHAAIASAIVFAINGLLVLYVFNFDRKIKQDRG